jgi:ribonuclease P protein component
VRAVEPDIVVHAERTAPTGGVVGPRIGLVVSKSVGSAVQRHRVARRLRHAARGVLTELDAGDRVVIRALPSSRHAAFASLGQQLRHGLIRARLLPEGSG